MIFVTTMTPWGKAQTITHVLRGVNFYSTASHGGMRVAEKFAKKNLSEQTLKEAIWYSNAYWFEEDSAYILPLYELTLKFDGFTQKAYNKDVSLDMIKNSVKYWYPNYKFAE